MRKLSEPYTGGIRFAHLESGFVAQARVTRGIDVSARRHTHGAEPCRELDVPHAPVRRTTRQSCTAPSKVWMPAAST